MNTVARVRSEAISPAARAVFSVYKHCVSPLIHAVAPTGCRYLPTCSEYAYTAFIRFGAIRGSWLSLRRLARCHPWANGGLDPVPSSGTAFSNESATKVSTH